MSRIHLATRLRYAALALVFALVSVVLPVAAGNGIDEAKLQIANGEYRAAIIELKNILQNDPGNTEARLLLGGLYLAQKDGAAAEKELRRAQELGVDPAHWHLNLVTALVLQRQFTAALKTLDQIEGQIPEQQPRALALYGRANLGLEKFEDAAFYYEEALALEPANQGALLGMLLLRLARQEFDAAAVAADELLARYPDDQDALLIRAELHRRIGDSDAAIEYLNRLLGVAPDSLRALIGRAAISITKGDFERATADLEHLDRVREGIPEALYLRGIIAFQAKEWEEAERHLQRLLLAQPDHIRGKFLLGLIGFSKGELQIAEEYLSSVAGVLQGNSQVAKALAATRIKLREPEKAIEVLEPLVGQGEDAQLMALLGSAYMMDGDVERGQEWLAQAVEVAPDLASIRTQLALSKLVGGQTDEAIGELESAVDLGQELLQADVLLVLAHLKDRQFDKAIAASQALEQRQPENPIAYNLTGLAYMAQQENEKAKERFAKALELDPDFVTAATNLARVAVTEGDLDTAERYYQDVLAKQPTHLVTMMAIAALAERREDTESMIAWLEKAQAANPSSVRPGLVLAEHYLKKQDAENALNTGLSLSQRFPEDLKVLWTLARAQELGGETAGSIRTFERITRLQPENAKIWYLLGMSKLKTEDPYGAREALDKAIALEPNLVQARAVLASLELQEGRNRDAMEIGRALQQDFPDEVVGYQIEGTAYLAEDRPDEAVIAFEKAFSKHRNSRLALLLGRSYRETDQYEKSIEVLEDWVAEQPDDLAALQMLGMTYHALGREAEAKGAYERIARSSSYDAASLNNLAWIYHETGDPRALETAKKAYDLDPDKPEIADTYGWVLLENGELHEGLIILQQAYVASPSHTEIGYHVAVGLARMDRKAEAIKVLRRLLAQQEEFPRAADAKALLAELEQ